MRRRPLSGSSLLLVGMLLLGSSARSARAQIPSLTVDQLAGARPVLTLTNLLADPDLQSAVQSGLPIRVRIRVELWRDAFFDELKGSENWSAIIAHQPLDKEFLVRTRGNPSTERRVPHYEAARALVEAGQPWSLRPLQRGRYYYTANLEIETLSLSDLEELERWLKGELKPAVSGDNSIPGAIGEGAKRLLIRVLALPARSIELRTDRFRVR